MLKSAFIPASVTTIDDGAFRYCRGLEKVKLNEGLEKIEYQAFANTAISEIEIPETVTYFFSTEKKYCSNNVFYGCA